MKDEEILPQLRTHAESARALLRFGDCGMNLEQPGSALRCQRSEHQNRAEMRLDVHSLVVVSNLQDAPADGVRLLLHRQVCNEIRGFLLDT